MAARVALDTAESDAHLQGYLAEVVYNPEKIQAGRVLLNATVAMRQKQNC